MALAEEKFVEFVKMGFSAMPQWMHVGTVLTKRVKFYSNIFISSLPISPSIVNIIENRLI